MNIEKIRGKWRIIDVIGFFVLAFFLCFFFIMILIESEKITYIVLFIISAVLLIIGFFVEWTKSVHKRWTIERDVGVIFAVILGAVVTYYISVYLGIGGYGVFGPVIGASLVGLVYAYIADILKGVWGQMPAPVYCGAFIGMVSSSVLPSIWMVALAGFFSGLIFVITHEVYTGTGGKLGTIAFGGVTIVKKFILSLFGL